MVLVSSSHLQLDPSEVTFSKQKGLTWMKGMFWIPTESVQNPDAFAALKKLRLRQV